MTKKNENAALPLERFTTAVANGDFFPDPSDPANRDGYRGMVFCVVGSEDEISFSDFTKIPLSIVLVMTPIIQSLPPSVATQAAFDWLQPRVGVMDDLAAERIVVDFLESSALQRRVMGNEGASEVHATLVRLHQLTVSRDPPSQSEWRAVRSRVIALLSGLDEHDAKALSYLGTAGWPVASAPELMRDLLNDEAVALAAIATRNRGLRQPDSSDWDIFRAVIDELKGAGKSKDEAFSLVDGVLCDRYPDVWKRLNDASALRRETSQESAQFMRTSVDRQFSVIG
ncbi:hypothetical protein FHY11_002165 [Xanthomonas arboricola]|uniref:hypothetical protein n=1 Tax=Xanthomonas euroxanthea TaxID=2259622 RepID=UPI00141BC994|nr:hypothetical protein [Xanthomonas euroxanthea]NIK08655.1 hypothetical protein [Xanthomonas euroxanthea]